MLTPEEISALREVIRNSQILNNEGKALFMGFLDAGEPYPDEFLGGVVYLIESEEQYIENEVLSVVEKIKELEAKKEEAEKKLFEKNKEVSEKLPELMNQEAENARREIKKADADFDHEVEAIIHDKAESSEIDDIRAKLMQPKK